MLEIDIHTKHAGSKLLMSGFKLLVARGDKVGLIGRNGCGKSTLFRMILGVDKDYDGKIDYSKNLIVLDTAQEHGGVTGTTLQYICSRLPNYTKWHDIIEKYPEHMGEDMGKIDKYSHALEEFSEAGYYDIENSALELFDAYQMPLELINQDFITLSGGQKRLVETIIIQLANPMLALLDEPTNHMDYVAKNRFVEWLRTTKSTVIVVSHDRDVLAEVTRVVELRDHKAFSYPGNYKSYLNQNKTKTINAINSYETDLKAINNLKEQIAYAKSKAPGYAGKAGKNPWVVMQNRLTKELELVLENHTKPSFWIDRESAADIKPDMVESYDKYKAKNIRLHKADGKSEGDTLLRVSNLSLGYGQVPLFENVSFNISSGDRLHVIGRNGAGKSTLVRAILDAEKRIRPATLIGKGMIECANSLRISEYSQEVSEEFLDKTVYDTIEELYRQKGLALNEQTILRDMGNYLFDPMADRDRLVESLSGGQKARLQLIKLLIGDPTLLILDEPTNHLDLPSIEELENALLAYKGAVIYISHDSYFAGTLGGEKMTIGS
jgi:ATP-binding cassette, subfamily F, member 3